MQKRTTNSYGSGIRRRRRSDPIRSTIATLLLGAVIAGITLGLRQTRISQHLPQQDRLN
jgi:hypothetical protein